MCQGSPFLTPKARTARGMGIAVLTLAIIGGLVEFIGSAIYGWLGGIAGILAIVASSMVVCCGPTQGGPGTGAKYKCAGWVAVVAAILAFAGAIAAIAVIITIRTAGDEVCLEEWCGSGKWQDVNCATDTVKYCSSEAECKQFETSQAVCDEIAGYVSAWVLAIAWPVIVFSFINFILDTLFAVYCFQAAPQMEAAPPPAAVGAQVQSQPVYSNNAAVPVAVAQPVAYATAPPTAYAVAGSKM